MNSTTLAEEHGGDVFAAVTYTVMSTILFLAFLRQHRNIRSKLSATICLVSSALGASLAWLAYVVDMYQEDVSYLPLKLIALGGMITLSGFILFGRWFADYLVILFKLKPPEQRVLFQIGKIGIRFSEIMRLVIMVLTGCLVLYIMMLKE